MKINILKTCLMIASISSTFANTEEDCREMLRNNNGIWTHEISEKFATAFSKTKSKVFFGLITYLTNDCDIFVFDYQVMHIATHANTDNFFAAYLYFAGEILHNNQEVRDFFTKMPEDYDLSNAQKFTENKEYKSFIKNLEFISRARNFYLQRKEEKKEEMESILTQKLSQLRETASENRLISKLLLEKMGLPMQDSETKAFTSNIKDQLINLTEAGENLTKNLKTILAKIEKQ